MNKRELGMAVTVALAIGGFALAKSLTIPNVFAPNTPARSGEVNANFGAVKTAVDEHDGRLSKLEARLVWKPLTLQAGWSNFSDEYQSAEYTVDFQGLVYLRGLVRRAMTTPDNTIANLPGNARPLKRVLFGVAVAGTMPGRVDVAANGNIEFVAKTDDWVQLNGIVFSTQ